MDAATVLPTSDRDPESVVIAHADAGTRFGARLALEEQGFRVAAECSTTGEAVELVRRTQPAACLIDVRLPGALEAIRAITSAHPPCAAVALSAGQSPTEVLAALRSGASGYLGTDIDPPLLPDALRGVLASEAVLPATTLAWMMERLQDAGTTNGDAPAERRGLTERHWQVLALVERRMTTAEIARELGVSPVTVRRHRSEIRLRSVPSPRPEDDGNGSGPAGGSGTPER
ncbi:MAG TPA: response regulator transcription factor [Solirubrobacteraceae bacterium]|nr:response regulator transcription factor [Solirubrobacteraceae bacterium]